MKHQVLFSLENNEKIFMNSMSSECVVNGALRVKRSSGLVKLWFEVFGRKCTRHRKKLILKY